MSPEKSLVREVAESMIAHQSARSEPIQQQPAPAPSMDFIRSLILDIPVQVERQDMNIEKMLENQLEAEIKKQETPSDQIDTVTVDIPLLLRLLEYSKEDAKTDMDLHDVTEKLIALSKESSVLSMDHYNQIVANASQDNASFAGDSQGESLDSIRKLAGIK
jgi:hypothetical protein